jgi:hypothetical protein
MRKATGRPRGRLLVGISIGVVLGAAAAVTAVAATGGPAKAPPPPTANAKVGAPAVKSTRTSKAGAVSFYAMASKNIAIGQAATVIASVTVPPGSYTVGASGSLWSTAGKGVQNIGCHVSTPQTYWGSSYASLDSDGVHQVPFAIIGAANVTAESTFQLTCLVGKSPLLTVVGQANLVVTKVTG